MKTALMNRQAAMVKLFWESGARSISELAYAVSQGAGIAELQKLLDQGAAVTSPQDGMFSPLALAANLGNLEVVKLLIAKGAEINGPPPQRELPRCPAASPMFFAAGQGQVEIVAYLLEKGARPDPDALAEAAGNSCSSDEQRPPENFVKIARLLLEAGAQKIATPGQIGNALASAVEGSDAPAHGAILKMYLDAGFSPDSPLDAQGQGPAAQHRHRLFPGNLRQVQGGPDDQEPRGGNETAVGAAGEGGGKVFPRPFASHHKSSLKSPPAFSSALRWARSKSSPTSPSRVSSEILPRK